MKFKKYSQKIVLKLGVRAAADRISAWQRFDNVILVDVLQCCFCVCACFILAVIRLVFSRFAFHS